MRSIYCVRNQAKHISGSVASRKNIQVFYDFDCLLNERKLLTFVVLLWFRLFAHAVMRKIYFFVQWVFLSLARTAVGRRWSFEMWKEMHAIKSKTS